MGIWLGAVVVALCAISVKVHGPVRVLVVHVGFARILLSSPSLHAFLARTNGLNLKRWAAGR